MQAEYGGQVPLAPLVTTIASVPSSATPTSGPVSIPTSTAALTANSCKRRPPLARRRSKLLSLLYAILSFFSISYYIQNYVPGLATTSAPLEGQSYDNNPAGSHPWPGRVPTEAIEASCREGDAEDEDDKKQAEWERALSDRFWTSGTEDPDSWSDAERQARDIPQFVLDYAPLVQLYSKEQFWPCDVAHHFVHTTPHLNYTPVRGARRGKGKHPSLPDLEGLERWGDQIFLQSDDDVEDRPEWLGGRANIPVPPDRCEDGVKDCDDNGDDDEDSDETDKSGRQEQYQPTSQEEWERQPWWDSSADPSSSAPLPFHRLYPPSQSRKQRRPLGHRAVRASGRQRRHRTGGRSPAPAILIVVRKPNNILDAFWFFFYSFNQGNTVMSIRFGNHVGDWEHVALRFHLPPNHSSSSPSNNDNNKIDTTPHPKAIFFSEHDFGKAYPFPSPHLTLVSNHSSPRPLGRPLIFTADGSHANYPTPGPQPYALPLGLLRDITDDAGPTWDPTLNLRSYTYDAETDNLRASTASPRAPTSWFYFGGKWGDKRYRLSDGRQYRWGKGWGWGSGTEARARFDGGGGGERERGEGKEIKEDDHDDDGGGFYHYEDGPLGPRFKNLGRRRICQGEGECRVRMF